MNLLFIDPQGIRHYVTLVRRCTLTPGMYVCEREDQSLVTVHASALLSVPTPQELDQHLDGDAVPIRHVKDVTLKQLVPAVFGGWTEWRNDAPQFGKRVEIMGKQQSARAVVIHSRLEITHLMDQGFSEWRYV